MSIKRFTLVRQGHLTVKVQEHLSDKSGKSPIHARAVTLALSATSILYLKTTQITKIK